jgi:hypothetical protein|nr:hypothetical protein [uncultured Flavobacterium sp.]
MNLKDFYPLLSEKRIMLSDTTINPRIYNAWKKEGILLEDEKKKQDSDIRKWVYLNVFEAMWLLIVVELRKLNLDLDTIKEVKDFLKQAPDLESIIRTYTEEEFQKKIVSNLPKIVLEQYNGILTKEDYLKILSVTIEDEKSFFMSNIGIVIYGVLIEKTFPSIIIELSDEKNNFNMAIAFNSPSKDNLKEDLFNFYTEKCANATFINLPILPIVQRLFENEKFDSHNINYGLYSKQESQLLDSIRDNECSEIKVIRHQSGDITMSFSEQDDIKGSKAKELRKLLGLKMYEKVEVTFRNENHLVIKNTQKKIIKNN